MRRESTRVSPKRYFHFVWPAVILTVVFMLLSGCVVYEPVPTVVPSAGTFDRAWSAALGAAQDEGVRITSEDRVKGVISGSRGEQDVTINVQTQADGNVRVEFSARGPKGSDPDWRVGSPARMTGVWAVKNYPSESFHTYCQIASSRLCVGDFGSF
jgi:hypothetical protein